MKKNYSIVFVVLLLLQQQAYAGDVNIASQIAEGGIAIVVIIGLSILALAVSFERFMHFRKRYIVPEGLIERVKPLWETNDFAAIEAILVQENSTLARVIQYMMENRHQSFTIISSGVGDIASLELRHHQQKAYALAIVATVAPIVGLLGTVIGMIEAFHVIAFSDGMGNPALLAGGISKALINTAMGLSVALPALGLHHYFKNRAAFLSLSLEGKVNHLINAWFMPAPVVATHLKVVGHAY